MTSIRDVAKLAGVSPSTVSRVMNGTAKVDEEKMQRVLNAISETGFKPNEVARSLFKKSSRIIGVIAPDMRIHSSQKWRNQSKAKHMPGDTG